MNLKYLQKKVQEILQAKLNLLDLMIKEIGIQDQVHIYKKLIEARVQFI